jgi:hypothetical protein
MPRHLVGAQAGDVAPVEQYPARGRGDGAADQVEERGLAGAVRPDDGVDRAACELDADVVDGRQAAEALGERIDFKHGSLLSRQA